MPAAESARSPAKSTAEPSSQMSQPGLTWIIMECAPRMAGDDKDMAPGADLVLDHEDPLLPSKVTIHRRIAADEKASACIVAVHPSGRFLLCTDLGGAEVDYILCDAGTRLARRIPPFTGLAIPGGYLRFGTRLATRFSSRTEVGISRGHPRRGTGLIANQRRDSDYLVAELYPAGSAHFKALSCYSTADRAWVVKRFASSPHHPPWESNGGVLAHAGKLWWVDSTHGLLTCDPSLERPDLCYIALPEPDDDDDTGSGSYNNRCVMVSQGHLRFAEIRTGSGEPRIIIWTLGSDPKGSVWNFEYQLLFKDLWIDESYRAAGLPDVMFPNIVSLIQPDNFGILYMFYEMRLVAIDIRAVHKRVIGVEDYTTQSIVAWELPRDLLRFDPGTSSVSAELSRCLICDGRLSGKYACDSCLGRIGLLLKRLKSTSKGSLKIDSICLNCGSTVGCKREDCAGFLLPVSRSGPGWTGWVSGKERWAPLFNGVQVDKACTVGMPISLHPPAGRRCLTCKDSMGAKADTLYQTSEFCSLSCWKDGQKNPQTWIIVLVSSKISDIQGCDDSFCTTCAESFSVDTDLSAHNTHLYVRLVWKDKRACIEIPSQHVLARNISNIVHVDGGAVDHSPAASLLIALYPRGIQRCARCSTCLVDGGGVFCSFTCSLSVPSLQPRSIQLRSRVVST